MFLGFDAKAGDYIAHWLDQFGAAGARVVATGHREGQTLVLLFPYQGSPFRDTLTLAADGSSGTLLLEAQKPGRQLVDVRVLYAHPETLMPAPRDTVASKLDERIETLKERLEQLKTRQARIEARKRALASRRARKDDTRRKILAGAILLAKVESGDFDSRTFRRWLDKALTRKDDRELFGL